MTTIPSLSEVRLLSLMLNESYADEAISEALPRLTGREFRDPTHQAIFEAVLATHAARQPILPEVVVRFLDPAFRRGQTGGVAMLWELICDAQTSNRPDALVSSVPHYIDEILRDHKERSIVALGNEMRSAGELSDEPDVAANHYLEKLREVARVEEPDRELAVDVLDAMAAIDAPRGVPTPWAGLNTYLGGWRPGMLTVVGARPGIGKSVFGTQAVLDVARRMPSESALMFSMEMSRTDVFHRLMSAIGSVDGSQIQLGCPKPADYQRMSEASEKVKLLPLIIDDRAALTLEQIRAKVIAQKRRQPVSLVVVDYLTLVAPADAKVDRRVQVDLIAQGLKNIAHEEQVPVVALAMVNRGSEQRSEKLPVLSDLRESGGIEAAADAVILMHRLTEVTEGDVEDLSLRIAKNRYGPLGTLHLRFQGQYSRITNMGAPPSELE